MLIGDAVFNVMQWVGLGAAAICGIGLRVTPRADRRAGLFLLGAVVALLVAFVPRWLAAPVVIVKIDERGQVDKTRGRLLGGVDYQFQDRQVVRISGARKGTLVVNDSLRTLQVETVYYGRSLGLGSSEPERVARMSTYEAPYGIDCVGPDNRPPRTVSTSTGLGMDFRHWLTW